MSEQQKSHDDRSDTPSVIGGIIVALLLGVAGYFTGGKFGVFVGLCFAYVIWLSVDPPWLNRKK